MDDFAHINIDATIGSIEEKWKDSIGRTDGWMDGMKMCNKSWVGWLLNWAKTMANGI